MTSEISNWKCLMHSNCGMQRNEVAFLALCGFPKKLPRISHFGIYNGTQTVASSESPALPFPMLRGANRASTTTKGVRVTRLSKADWNN